MAQRFIAGEMGKTECVSSPGRPKLSWGQFSIVPIGRNPRVSKIRPEQNAPIYANRSTLLSANRLSKSHRFLPALRPRFNPAPTG